MAVVIDLSAKDWYECASLVLKLDFFGLYRWEYLLLVRVAGPRYQTAVTCMWGWAAIHLFFLAVYSMVTCLSFPFS
jgi:hypothetical protein